LESAETISDAILSFKFDNNQTEISYLENHANFEMRNIVVA